MGTVLIRLIVLLLVLCLVNSCKNKNQPIDEKKMVMVMQEPDTSRYVNKSHLCERFVGKYGYIDILQIDVYSNILDSLALNRERIDKIDIPFHCQPVIQMDSITIITSPRLYMEDMKILVIINYHKIRGIGGNVEAGIVTDMLPVKNKVEIKATYKRDFVLYDIDSNMMINLKSGFVDLKRNQYCFSYENIIGKGYKIVEFHKFTYLKNKKFKVEELSCD